MSKISNLEDAIKLKKIKQAYTVNGVVIDQLSKHHENITEQIQKKIERFENA